MPCVWPLWMTAVITARRRLCQPQDITEYSNSTSLQYGQNTENSNRKAATNGYKHKFITLGQTFRLTFKMITSHIRISKSHLVLMQTLGDSSSYRPHVSCAVRPQALSSALSHSQSTSQFFFLI